MPWQILALQRQKPIESAGFVPIHPRQGAALEQMIWSSIQERTPMPLVNLRCAAVDVGYFSTKFTLEAAGVEIGCRMCWIRSATAL